ncbi:MAG: hypothetical protein HY293_10025 [Planctomycetes bacterium]|nr:hypothetical protein [Planctomycetota bacterium]
MLLLAACSPTGTRGDSPKGKSSGELEVTVEVESSTASPREGDLSTVVFKIRNGTANALVLRDLTQPRDLMLAGSSGAVMTWQFTQAGLVSYSAEKDEWTYEKGRRSDAPRPVFNSGLLVPEETLQVRARVRLLEMPMDFQFSYFELSPEELRRKVYFEFREAKLMRYRTLVGRELADRLVPSLRPEEAGHRFVIFPHAEPIASTTLLKTFRLNQPLRPRFFRLDQACQKAGIKKPRAGDYSYSTAYDAWVLPKDNGHVLVTPASVSPLPELRQMERTFHLLDSSVPDKVFIELRAHSAASALSDLKGVLLPLPDRGPVRTAARRPRPPQADPRRRIRRGRRPPRCAQPLTPSAGIIDG